MSGDWRIEGHAIVSADDCIADASGKLPDNLLNPADWRLFQAALDEAAVVALGRPSHLTHPNREGRNRLVMTSKATGLMRRDDAWWWNPGDVPLGAALAAAAPDGGIVAVPGGHFVFDYFLDTGFDAFHLSRQPRVRLPGGTPLFSGLGPGRTAETVLAASGLVAGATTVIDAAAGTTHTSWLRPPA